MGRSPTTRSLKIVGLDDEVATLKTGSLPEDDFGAVDDEVVGQDDDASLDAGYDEVVGVDDEVATRSLVSTTRSLDWKTTLDDEVVGLLLSCVP